MVGICSWALKDALGPRISIAQQMESVLSTPFDRVDVLFDERSSVGTLPSGNACALTLTLKPVKRLSLIHDDPDHVAQVTALLKVLINAAAETGTPDLSLSPGAIPRNLKDLEAVRSRLHHAIAELTEEAAVAGVSLNFENLPGHWFGMLERVKAATDAMPNLGFCLDTGNTLASGKSVGDWLGVLAGKIRKLHISDVAMSPSGFLPTAIGEGEMLAEDQAAVLAALSPQIPVYFELPPGSVSAVDQEFTFGHLMQSWQQLATKEAV